jgi:hypothetical protein
MLRKHIISMVQSFHSNGKQSLRVCERFRSLDMNIPRFLSGSTIIPSPEKMPGFILLSCTIICGRKISDVGDRGTQRLTAEKAGCHQVEKY